ncbi:tRNA preQ1(34) S-adenosylmethionine ribosyltransferase-isomerase QueA [Candidatus Uhrbacteria bacterium]|nr:tRNA preQ1(34) S-adenosylmethionine ribosyltransferase-isomerase QueA [Candidatus Uhrbacteria bacterium]
MNISNFSYTLPQSSIAQTPAKPRDGCKLLAINCQEEKMRHLTFTDLPNVLRAGDVLVWNDSKVIPARLYGKKQTGGQVEIFLVKKLSAARWAALLKNVSEKNEGHTLALQSSTTLTAHPIHKNTDGTWVIRFSKGGTALDTYIGRHGDTPTPPYIKKHARLVDYQTVYARQPGSVAAPTAGLHITKRLIKKLQAIGVEMHSITLHVGIGTFLPIRTDKIEHHTMHPEYAEISPATARAITQAKKQGRRIIALGTTAVRTLEAFGAQDGSLASGAKYVKLFISPGYDFRITDAMITNFHLPHSTLLVLVCAFAEWKHKGGMQFILNAYKIAVEKRYRFYSFGDAMFVE